MSSQPFLGSKISLISKANIRYEGILFSIDTKQSTVALSKVKSFGTEDRPAEKLVPPRDEIYEYIIFRGSDIHDLHVCEPPKPEDPQMLDPAIVTISQNTLPKSEAVTPPKHDPPNLSYQQPARSPSASQQGQPEHSGHENLGRTHPMAGTDRPGTFPTGTTNSHISPTPLLSASELNHAAREPYKPSEYSNYRNPPAPSNGYGQAPGGSRSNYSQSRHPHQPTNYSGYSYDYEANSGYRNRGPGGSYANAASRAPGNAYQDSYYGGQENYGRGGYRYNQARYTDNTNQASQGNYRGGGGGVRYGSNYYSRSDGGTAPSNRQGQYSGRGGNRGGSGKTQFKDDYDFESANATIADELAKLNVGHKSEGEEVAGEDSSHEHESYKSANEQEDNQPHASGDKSEENPQHFYDKKKSFFDTISSETVDRANGVRITQLNRNEERRVNVETFGTGGGPNNYGYRGGRGGPRREGGGGYYGGGRSNNYYGPRRGGWSAAAQQY